MAERFKQYLAPAKEIRPSEEGSRAWQEAAYRQRQFATESSVFIREGAGLRKQMVESLKGLFPIYHERAISERGGGGREGKTGLENWAAMTGFAPATGGKPVHERAGNLYQNLADAQVGPGGEQQFGMTKAKLAANQQAAAAADLTPEEARQQGILPYDDQGHRNPKFVSGATGATEPDLGTVIEQATKGAQPTVPLDPNAPQGEPLQVPFPIVGGPGAAAFSPSPPASAAGFISNALSYLNSGPGPRSSPPTETLVPGASAIPAAPGAPTPGPDIWGALKSAVAPVLSVYGDLFGGSTPLPAGAEQAPP